MSDKKYDTFFETVLSASMIISTLKLELAEKITQKFVSMLEENKVEPTKDELEDIETATKEIVSEIEPSFFNVPLGWEPRSEDDMKKKLETLDQRRIENIVDNVLNKLRSGQSSITRYF